LPAAAQPSCSGSAVALSSCTQLCSDTRRPP
jgi:hypothetical protein